MSTVTINVLVSPVWRRIISPISGHSPHRPSCQTKSKMCNCERTCAHTTVSQLRNNRALEEGGRYRISGFQNPSYRPKLRKFRHRTENIVFWRPCIGISPFLHRNIASSAAIIAYRILENRQYPVSQIRSSRALIIQMAPVYTQF